MTSNKLYYRCTAYTVDGNAIAKLQYCVLACSSLGNSGFDELKAVVDGISDEDDVIERWTVLGIELGVNDDELEIIKRETDESSFMKMMKDPEISLESLLKALRSRLVKLGKLADMVKSKTAVQN